MKETWIRNEIFPQTEAFMTAELSFTFLKCFFGSMHSVQFRSFSARGGRRSIIGHSRGNLMAVGKGLARMVRKGMEWGDGAKSWWIKATDGAVLGSKNLSLFPALICLPGFTQASKAYHWGSDQVFPFLEENIWVWKSPAWVLTMNTSLVPKNVVPMTELA